MGLKQGEFSPHLNTFEFEGKREKVSFVETVKVNTGVECDVYKFDQDGSKDLGVIRIDPGQSTPLQKVLKGEKTIEGYISGKGKLVVTGTDDRKTEYRAENPLPTPIMVTVAVGEKMQWRSDVDSPLVAYEICFPPYEDGRYENLLE